MILRWLIARMIGRAEKRLGVELDYVRQIESSGLGLLMRYNKIFGVLNPNRHARSSAYHAARLRGAIATDCRTCVTAEINLAKQAGVSREIIDQLLSGQYSQLPKGIAAVARLADSVVNRRQDDPHAREIVKSAYGDAGLVELCFAMNGTAFLPVIKLAMGHARQCDLEVVRKITNGHQQCSCYGFRKAAIDTVAAMVGKECSQGVVGR